MMKVTLLMYELTLRTMGSFKLTLNTTNFIMILTVTFTKVELLCDDICVQYIGPSHLGGIHTPKYSYITISVILIFKLGKTRYDIIVPLGLIFI